MNYKNKIKPKKRYGQNFLINQNKIREITEVIKNNDFDAIIEIGPGKGAITDSIIKLNKDILLIEIDFNLTKMLENKYKLNKNVFIVCGDFLKYNLKNMIEKYLKEKKKIIIFSNLPYYITTPIIFKIMNEKDKRITNILFMVQKEYGDRLSAKPKTRAYNSLTIMTNLFYKIKKIIELEANDFFPKPKVKSVFLEMKPYQNERISKIDQDEYFYFLKKIFTYPRKNIMNNLKILTKNENIINTILFEENIKKTARAQELKEEKIFNLFKNFQNKGIQNAN